MPTEETRRTIDALTREALVGEIASGVRSRFQGESAAYLDQRLAQLDGGVAAERVAREQVNFDSSHQVATRSNEIANDANRLSTEANDIAFADTHEFPSILKLGGMETYAAKGILDPIQYYRANAA